MTLQRIYYHFKDTTTAGQISDAWDLGSGLVDGWLTRMRIKLTWTTVMTAAGTENVISFGLRTEPQEVVTPFNKANSVYYDDLFEDFLTDTNEAAVFHGSRTEMNMYHILVDKLQTATQSLSYTKFLRMPIQATNFIEFMFNSRTLEGTADTAGIQDFKLELEHVIAPNKWRSRL